MKKLAIEKVKMLDSDKRVFEYSVMLNRAEIEHFDAVAKSASMNKANYFRALIYDCLPKILPQPSLKMIANLGRDSNNLNQIARALNSGENLNIDAVQSAINSYRLSLMEVKT